MFVSTGLMKAFSFVSMIPLARGGFGAATEKRRAHLCKNAGLLTNRRHIIVTFGVTSRVFEI